MTHAWRVPISEHMKPHKRREAHWLPLPDFNAPQEIIAAPCGREFNPRYAVAKRAVNRFCAGCRRALAKGG